MADDRGSTTTGSEQTTRNWSRKPQATHSAPKLTLGLVRWHPVQPMLLRNPGPRLAVWLNQCPLPSARSTVAAVTVLINRFTWTELYSSQSRNLFCTTRLESECLTP